MSRLTPMLRQYLGIKDQYPDAILFFRMGDFYEMFFDDARIASKILGITLTARGTLNGKKVPMCGVPYHASRSYIGRLVESGRKVAICEQVEDPRESKGIVKREVVRLVTPGSIVDEGDLDDKSNLYIAAISREREVNISSVDPHGNKKYGLAHADLSTGDFRVTETNSFEELFNELGRIDPAEIVTLDIYNLAQKSEFADYPLEILDTGSFDPENAEEILRDQLGVKTLSGLGLAEMPNGLVAAGILSHYLRDTQRGFPAHIKKISTYHIGEFMFLDGNTCLHLELLKTMRRQSTKGSLFQVLDRTLTPMGSRTLKKWITYPLINLNEIRKRLGAVSSLKEDPFIREKIREELKEICDLERLNGRIALGKINARDLLAMKSSISRLPRIKDMLKESMSVFLSELASEMDTLDDIGRLIEEAIHDDPPVSIRDGNIIKEGYDTELDRLISLSRNGKAWIKDFASTEQKRTGISSLKVGFNKIYGYYIEISKTNIHLVPADYIRKQTLVNGERYITESLKNMEEQVLSAEEKRIELESAIFERIRKSIASKNQRIKMTAEIIAKFDVIAGLAEIAEINNYVCPEVNESRDLIIIDGRHPVIEQTVKDEDFVPNDIQLDSTEQQMLIITGPNMAGKSTVLRQTALTVLMAQMGSFVPASKTIVGLVDRIFTRVGATDDLAKGQSTFMVEMNETANILHHATPRSLAILDEIGRGTSTYDGLSIAWAIAESLHDMDGEGVRTLFATHYHELTALAATKHRIKNFNIAVREWQDQIIFLRKLVPGGTSRSYGIQVARIAGLPENVLKRAKEILDNLEEGGSIDKTLGADLTGSSSYKAQDDMVQLNLFGIKEMRIKKWLQDIDISSITPLEALIELNKLKEYVDSNG